jgi:hypothetical protein
MLQFFLHSSGLTLLALAILTIALIIGFGKERYQAFFGVQHFFRYPPLWIAMLTGLFVLLMADQTTLPPYPDPELLVALAIFIATTIPFLICNASICNVNQSSEHEPHKAKQERLYNFDDIKKWAEDDKEILTPDDDRFDHKITAQRIAERLIKKETASIAVIGPLGSGKSTLGKLVEYQLKPQPKMIFVQLSLWPYATVDAAVTGVIDTLIKALAKHVNVLALHSLPSDYVASIENADGILGSLVRLFKRSDQPEDVLERLGEIIGATRLKVVLWIEDLERFSGTAQLSHEQAIQREAELLGPLRSLLYLLDASPSISVVIADTNLSSRFDIDKIARFIERPPRVKKEVFVRLLAEVRNRCLNDWPIQTIQLRVPETNGIHDINKTLNINNATVDAIYELINTPRQLKHLLRIVIETWDKLPGEINFDSMLYATTLRLACPDVFALLDKYSPAMTRRTTNDQGAGGLGVLYSSLRTDQSIEDYYADLNQHLNNLGNKTQKEKTITILNVLTPFTFTQDKKDSRSSPDKKPKPLVVSDVMSPAYEDTPQSLFSSSPTDYWGRYLSMSDIDDEESDQKLLKKIDAWKSDAPKELIDAIFVQGSAAQIEYLYPFFTPTELTELLLSAAREHTDPRYGQTDLKEVGTLRVLEMLYRATTSQENSISDLRCDAIIECVNIVIPQHIDLAKGICIRAFRTGGQAFTPEKEQEFIASICQNLTETYPNDQNTVDNFLKAIGKACPQISSVQIP